MTVTKTQHTQPGKGGAYVQLELKDIRDGTKMNERFRSGETLNRVILEEKSYQFLFQDGDQWTFMDQETYDQVTLDTSLIPENARPYLKDSVVVTLTSHEEAFVGLMLPDKMVLTVTDTEPVVKGQTATSSFKPAVCDNGVRVMVPPYISVETKIIVNTQDNTFIERAKD